MNSGEPLRPWYQGLKHLEPHLKRGTAILTYHKIGARPTGTLRPEFYVSTKQFKKQMQELTAGNIRVLSLADSLAPPASNEHRLVLTFDDGYRNVLREALPVLKEFGIQAMHYLVPGHIGGFNDWDAQNGEAREPLMSEGEIREWIAAGQQIGSHTVTHAWLTRLSVAEARREIFESKRMLEDRFGIGVDHFCYPYGDWNTTVRELVLEAGYKSATTIDAGVNGLDQDPLTLKRLLVFPPLATRWRLLKLALKNWMRGQ